MKPNKRSLVYAAGILGCLTLGSLWHFTGREEALLSSKARHSHPEAALVAIMKNDHKAFEKFIAAGGDVHAFLPAIEGKKMTVAEGIVHFERTAFVKHLQEKKISFLKQKRDGSDDALSMAVSKNNPELFAAILNEKPDLSQKYGNNQQTLLHLASKSCSHKVADLLGKNHKFDLHQKDQQGKTSMTLAAENDCVPMLSNWKEQKADFHQKDGKGESAISILKKKDKAELVQLVQKLEGRNPASSGGKTERVTFYKKRIFPKDQLADPAALIEPEIRPLDATDTADYSEFSD